MIDFHTHILPRMDDGSHSTDESVLMLRQLYSQGVDMVCATPHFYADASSPDAFLSSRKKSFENLKATVSGAEDIPKILLGAEVAYYEGISESDVLPELTLEGTSYLLLEMPYAYWNDRMRNEIYAISARRGITPVIAHIDRYFSLHGLKNSIAYFDGLPVLKQVNAGSFGTYFGAKKLSKLFLGNKTHILGSDCHNMNNRRPDINVANDYLNKHCPEVLTIIKDNEQRIIG